MTATHEAAHLEVTAGDTRITEIAALGATRFADLAALGTMCLDDLSALEATRLAEIVALEATCPTNITTFEAARTRHIRTNLDFVYDAIGDGDIVVQHVRTMNNLANTLTVAENRDRFRTSITVLSVHTA